MEASKYTVHPNGCWEWNGCRHQQGYGLVGVRKPDGRHTSRGAHVIAWEEANGRARPEGVCVRHTCDNPPCVNPAHLLLGTDGQNLLDAYNRRRRPQGIEHHSGRLTDDQVRELRRLYAEGSTFKDLGVRFEITTQYASMLALRKRRTRGM